MVRALKSAEQLESDVEVKQDRLIFFFQTAWHLKDHVRHDPSLRETVRQRIVGAAHSDPTLRVVRDLCNGTKHMRVDGGSSAEMAGHANMSIYVGGPPGSPGPLVAGADPLITYPDGRDEPAVDVALAAARAWTKIFNDEQMLPA